jgi:hypothetical protein
MLFPAQPRLNRRHHVPGLQLLGFGRGHRMHSSAVEAHPQYRRAVVRVQWTADGLGRLLARRVIVA